ncbi:glycosyltransferase family 4 protein [Butyrivibrio fibrisolvens]|uniref:glycosyltransferase family 4 protein n=1 Tax=Butyrivibrio fibrisolvens TaxID=831 RepID=UPI0003B79AA5|nr:glycosyltransferase family 4 protein [Butyrivibrio fibrisolvens]
MRILVVSEPFYPDIYAVNDLVQKLSDRGHEVTVLTGLPDYATGLTPEEYRHGQNRDQHVCGAHVRRVFTVARHKGPIWRSLDYMSFVINGNHAARHWDWDEFDVIYVWEVSPVTQVFPALALGKRFHKPVYVYCMDIWPECVKAMGFKEGSIFYRIIHAISKKAYRKADHIAISSKPFREYLTKVDGVDNDKITYLPQYGPQWLLEEDYSSESDRNAGDSTDCDSTNSRKNFLFIGNIGKATKLDVFIRAVKTLVDRATDNGNSKYRDKISVTIAGNGTEADYCKNLVSELALDDVIEFVGSVPMKETGNLYRKADCCVFTLDGSNRIGDTLPGKVQTYMAAGKPIIASCNGAGRDVVNESGAGIAVEYGDYEAMADAMASFIDDPEKFSDCGDKARKYFRENFLEEIHLSQLERELKDLIEDFDLKIR